MQKELDEQIFYNKTLDEKLIYNKLQNEMECYIIKKKGFIEKQVAVCVKYGSLDNEFVLNGEKIKVPYGMAHFLEHKLFEEQTFNVFDKFAKAGAKCNAYTNFTTTAYHFNCSDNFDKNLDTLLSFVSNPYFTDENVNAEKGIIAQEISMYNDDPNWMVYFNMLRATYKNIDAKEDIAGTEQSINEATKDILYNCYNHFYIPSNMGVVAVGDFSDEQVNLIYKQIEHYFKPNSTIEKISREIKKEDKTVVKKEFIHKMDVDLPLFHIGFKENDFENNDLNCALNKILVDIICGESSQLYNDLFSKDLINNEFDSTYLGNNFFGMSVFMGSSKQPKLILQEILNKIELLKKDGINKNIFEAIKRKHLGRFIRGFNSIDAICSSQVDYFVRDTNFINMYSVYEQLSLEQLNDKLKKHFNEENCVLSIVE